MGYPISIALLSLIFSISLGCQPDIKPQGLSTPFEVEVTGQEYEWYFRYPGNDLAFNTQDDRVSKKLRVPMHTKINLILKSEDFLYTIHFPDFDAKEIAVPGMTHVLKFSTKKKGTFPFKGNQLCGFSHESLFGNMKVLSAKQFDN